MNIPNGPPGDNPLVSDYLEARIARDKAQARVDELGERLIKQMEADQRKSYRWRAEGHANSLTVVVKHTTDIDERGLRRAMHARNFDRYTKRVLDRKAMENAMDAGEVDPTMVARFVTQRPHKPYLDFRSRSESTEGE
jgi:hypothetical protein